MIDFSSDWFYFLDEEYIPENLPFREGQIEKIRNKIEKFKNGFNPSYLLIYGKTGLGKTACVKYVFKNFQLQKIKYIYINAFLHETLNSILSRIFEELKIGLSTKGFSNEEIFSAMMSHLKNTGLKLVLCIDEVDKIKDLNELLYLFSRSSSLFGYGYVYLILISNNKDFILNLDARVLSSINFEELEFKPYSFEQLKVIAKERLKLLSGIKYEEAALTLIANRAYNNNSDVRIILKTLRKVLELLIEEEKREITVEIVKRVISEKTTKTDKETSLSPEDPRLKEIIEILKDETLTTTELYERISKKFQIKKRMFNYLIKKLKDMEIIEIHRMKGVRGSKFIVKLKN